MKVSDIIKRIRNTAGDINVLQFTDTMIVDWINDGIKACVVSNSLLQKTANQNCVVGQSEYNLPSDIFKLYSVLVDGAKIRISTLQEWEELNSGEPVGVTPIQGRVQQAFVWAKKLNLYPVPDSTYPLRINYIYEPTFIVWDGGGAFLDAEPAIPSSYHDRLVVYCLAQIALQDEDMAKYQIHMQEFSTGVIDLRHQTETEEDLYPSISVSSRDQGTEYIWGGSW